MKIVCDNCATKYSIADEKVRGKVFKIRCKKCSHIIVVRGGADGNAEASRDAGPSSDAGFPGEDQATMAAGSPPLRAGTPGGGVPATGGSGDAVWHLVIDREQVGPLTPAEVRQKFSAGEIDVETYAWREGFGDWLRLGSIEDFRDLGTGGAAPDEATRRSDSADLFAGAGSGDDSAPQDQPAGDLFGGAAASPAFSSAPAPAAAEADVFGGGGGGGLFGAPSAAPAPRPSRTSSPGFAAAAAAPAAEPAGGVDVRPMTGQRNENSVLFSLNNLQALATGGGGGGKSANAPEPRPGFANSQTEGSGLIDIRAMAASTLAASPSSGPSGSKDELPGLGAAPVFSPMAAPILMPAAPSGPPKWMWAILGVGVMAVLGIVVVGVLLLTRKPEPAVVATAPGTQPVAGAPAAAAPTAGAPAAAAPAAGAPAAAAPTAGAPAAAVAQNEKPAADEKKHAKADKGSKADKGTKMAKADTAPAAKQEAAPAAAAAPAPKKSGGKHDALDDLLNDASPESKPAGSAKKAAREESSGGGGSDESLPDTLDKGQVVAGMGKVKSNVTACYDQYHVPGMAMVALTIAPSGKVSSANVTGQFAGTPTGECVAKAVKKASFPRFKGAPMPINYPYVLR